MKGKDSFEPVEIKKGFHIVPSVLDLSGVEIELAMEAGNQYILKELIDEVSEQYDYVLIDCPPSLGLLTINAFTAANEIIIPLQAEYFALQGLAKMIDVIDKVKKRLNKELKIGGVLITQYSHRKVLNREVVDAAEDYFGSIVFKTKIRDNISLAEAPAHKMDIFNHNPYSHGATDYMALSKEILKNK
jgi:chromosome partitioning protein